MSQSQQTQTTFEAIQSTHGYSSEMPIADAIFIGTTSPRNPNERWKNDPYEHTYGKK